MGNIRKSVNFSQGEVVDYLVNEENSKFYFSVYKENGMEFFDAEGICYGLVNDFLIYSTKNKGDKYLKTISHSLGILNRNSIMSTPLQQIKHDALRIHAKQLFNHYMYGAISIQSVSKKDSEFFSYFFDIIEMARVEYSKIEKRNIGFVAFIKELMNKYHSDVQSDNKEYFDYLHSESQLKIEKYSSYLFAEPDFFKTEAGKKIVEDPIYQFLISNIDRDEVDHKYTVKDAECFIDAVVTDMRRDLYDKFDRFNKVRGITVANNDLDSFINQRVHKTTLTDFIQQLVVHTNISKEPFLYRFSSEVHAMAVTAHYDDNYNMWQYKFFDPNEGCYTTGDIQLFIDFMYQNVEEKRISMDSHS